MITLLGVTRRYGRPRCGGGGIIYQLSYIGLTSGKLDVIGNVIYGTPIHLQVHKNRGQLVINHGDILAQ